MRTGSRRWMIVRLGKQVFLTASHLKNLCKFLVLSHQKFLFKPAGNWAEYFLVHFFCANLRMASHAVWNENIWRGRRKLNWTHYHSQSLIQMMNWIDRVSSYHAPIFVSSQMDRYWWSC